MTDGNGSIWRKLMIGVVLTMLPLAVAGFVKIISLNSTVQDMQTTIDRKADRDVVEAEYSAILRELQAMHDQLNRIDLRR